MTEYFIDKEIENSIKSFANIVNSIIAKNSNIILSIDFFYTFDYKPNGKGIYLSKSYTYSNKEYPRLILEYLSLCGSLANIKANVEEYSILSTNVINDNSNFPLEFNSYGTLAIPDKTSNISDYVKFLEYKSFGKSLIWINSFSHFDKSNINLSATVIFNIELDKVQQVYIEKEIYSKIITKGLNIILENYNSIIKSNRNLLEKNTILQEIDNRLAAHHHTVFNSISSGRLVDAENAINDLKEKINIENFDNPRIVKAQFNKIVNKLSDAQKNIDFLSLILHIVFKSEKHIQISELTIYKMFRTLIKLTPKETKIPKIKLFKNDLSADRKFTADDSFKVFTILWNLWHNAQRNSFGCKPKIILDTVASELHITVITGEKMEQKYIELYASDKIETKPRRGIPIIKNYAQSLGWNILPVQIADSLQELGFEETDNEISAYGYTKIEIVVNKN